MIGCSLNSVHDPDYHDYHDFHDYYDYHYDYCDYHDPLSSVPPGLGDGREFQCQSTLAMTAPPFIIIIIINNHYHNHYYYQ